MAAPLYRGRLGIEQVSAISAPRASALTNVTRSVSDPNTDPTSLTSFATTRSSFFSRSMRSASAVASPVSALKPTTTAPGRRAATMAVRMSGFCVIRRSSSLPASRFLILRSIVSIGR